jgi:hypothetical protein
MIVSHFMAAAFRVWLGVIEVGLLALAIVVSTWGVVCVMERRFLLLRGHDLLALGEIREIDKRQRFASYAFIVVCSAFIAVTVLLVVS